jgi:hypothetical protein
MIPSVIYWGDHEIPVRILAQAELDTLRGEPGSLGFYWTGDDDSGDYIALSADQPHEGQVSILIHELMHVAEQQLIACGLLDGDIPHEFITYGAGSLFAMLATSGMLAGVYPDVARRFIAEAQAGEEW